MKDQVAITKLSPMGELIFFGNYFYGFCAVALSIEAVLQQKVPLNGPLYFLMIFVATVFYYTIPYVRKCSFLSSNPRTNWYSRNYEFVRSTQIILSSTLLFAFVLFLAIYYKEIVRMSATQWIVILIFPIVSVLYYGNTLLAFKYNLRTIGWLKPFVIGFIWAGMVTVYPVLFQTIVNNNKYVITTIGVLLFVKNLMFIALLCVMFDIKDYATDYIHRLRTFVVNIGLRKTIFYLLIPLAGLGLFLFIGYATMQGFHPVKILLNVLPFVLMINVARSLRRRRSILYYLVIVDGLMLVKALCGTIAMWFF